MPVTDAVFLTSNEAKPQSSVAPVEASRTITSRIWRPPGQPSPPAKRCGRYGQARHSRPSSRESSCSERRAQLALGRHLHLHRLRRAARPRRRAPRLQTCEGRRCEDPARDPPPRRSPSPEWRTGIPSIPSTCGWRSDPPARDEALADVGEGHDASPAVGPGGHDGSAVASTRTSPPRLVEVEAAAPSARRDERQVRRARDEVRASDTPAAAADGLLVRLGYPRCSPGRLERPRAARCPDPASGSASSPAKGCPLTSPTNGWTSTRPAPSSTRRRMASRERRVSRDQPLRPGMTRTSNDLSLVRSCST